MQKFSLSHIIRVELIRALVFGLGFVTVTSIGFVSVAYAANGWLFGDILNKILASGNWEAPGDGTVANSLKLWNIPAADFVRVKAWQSCGAGKCVMGFQADGTVDCTP
jgi:hypothetical protein